MTVTQTTPTTTPATTFPRRSSEHAPNLATLAQLRSTGRTPLLSAATRRPRSTTSRMTASRSCES